jgi:hypothetical protein
MNACSCRTGGLLAAVPLVLGLLGPAPTDAQRRQRIGVVEQRSFGVMSGDPRFEFGDITGFSVDAEHDVVLVFDRQKLELSAFTNDGRYVASVGRSGAGPGEFRGAARVAGPTTAGGIYVPDHINSRISRWVLRGDSLVLTDEVRYHLAGPICHLGDDLYLMAYSDGNLIQKLDSRGLPTIAFGTAFVDGDPVIERFTANGKIACDANTQSVFVAATVYPVVRRYSALDGQLIWEAAVPDMVTPVVTRNSRSSAGLPMFRPAEGQEGWEPIVSVLVAPGDQLLVQYGSNAGVGNGREIVSVTTVAYDIHTGQLRELRTDLPRLDFATAKNAYSHANEPFPRVRVFRWR